MATLKEGWKGLFSHHLELGSSPVEFALATVSQDGGAPRVRYCVHRGFWANLPANPFNKLRKNAAVYDSDCPVFTTDARSSKVADILAVAAANNSGLSGSGGGGLVEAAYFFRHVMIQWRIRGRCWILAADDFDHDAATSPAAAAAAVKAKVAPFMRRRDGASSGADADAWDWRLEIENQFENLSPGMRGSFKAAAPGQPLAQHGDDDTDKNFAAPTAGHLQDEPLARKHFRVAIITPDQVEQVDLSNPERRRRFVWTRADDLEWTVVETTA